MKSHEITIAFQNNEITIRRNGSDTFIGEVGSMVLHTFNRMKADTFAKRFYVFNAYIAPIISKRTGITYLHSK